MRTPFLTASSCSSLVAVTPIGFRPGNLDKKLQFNNLSAHNFQDYPKFMLSHPLRPWSISALGLIDILFLSRPANNKLKIIFFKANEELTGERLIDDTNLNCSNLLCHFHRGALPLVSLSPKDEVDLVNK